MKYKLWAAFSILLGLASPAWAASPVPGNKFVLVIGIDGLRGDAITCSACAKPPTIMSLMSGGAYHTNVLAGGSQDTKSGPGWATQFTGYWASSHGVTSNDLNLVMKKPHVFDLIEAKYPTATSAVVGDWENITTNLKAKKADDVSRNAEKNSQQATNTVKGWLARSTPPTAIFYYLHNVDIHVCCYEPSNATYKSKILAEDGQIKQVLDALKARPSYASENWLIVVISDHGGTGSSHGGQSASERATLLVMNNTFGNTSHSSFCTPGNKTGTSLQQDDALTPHVLAFMGVSNTTGGTKLSTCR